MSYCSCFGDQRHIIRERRRGTTEMKQCTVRNKKTLEHQGPPLYLVSLLAGASSFSADK
jgi:hypothetical protein